MTEIKFDTAYEVSYAKYLIITKMLSGSIAHREEDGKYYVKLWEKSCRKTFAAILIGTHKEVKSWHL